MLPNLGCFIVHRHILVLVSVDLCVLVFKLESLVSVIVLVRILRLLSVKTIRHIFVSVYVFVKAENTYCELLCGGELRP